VPDVLDPDAVDDATGPMTLQQAAMRRISALTR
jgi:hypothetical protein